MPHSTMSEEEAEMWERLIEEALDLMRPDWDVELDEAHEEALLDAFVVIEELMEERDAL